MALAMGCAGIDSMPMPDNNPSEEIDSAAGETSTEDDTPDASDAGEEPEPVEVNCDNGLSACAVSYTHLTLPTICSV